MMWLVLVGAGFFEIVWAYTMKLSEGFTKPGLAFVTLVFMGISFSMLAWAMRTIPLGSAYTVWTGIGAVGAFIVGIVFLGESVNLMRILAALLIISGLILMKLTS